MLVSLKEILDRAAAGSYAVAAPNVENEIDARACIEAAEDANAPLILDVIFAATPDIYFFGQELRKLAEQASVPIAINLDHGDTLDQIQGAINAGFTGVMIDRSAYPNEKNIADTKEIVRLAHAVGISVEAELGHVGQADNYAVDRDAALTSPEEALRFIEETGVDCLAVAIGTAHGAYSKQYKPTLDFERLIEIKKATNNFPLVLHGSSGTDKELLKKACSLGINKVNVNNDLCQAAVKVIKNGDFEGNNAYFVYYEIKEAVRIEMIKLIGIYGSANKAWIPEIKQLPRIKEV